ncbi:type-F conjugative transfer system pilin assembly protein TrbC (plasmid) [Acinetobacter seifertii]|uniref:type-F conjugative transfer system pilin assembly protein TrbC n=1 Tax=Acinetobacter seifertii TaxID=1530123 RepID=UPI00168B05FA|nr:type-F conjugative transfer system pilin assembly protein TrbC [Acinetobacter seifertii]QNX28739.1 type-F conjugative transfer system pilin assembly protein TrbC [Acinetobacter seifertii]
MKKTTFLAALLIGLVGQSAHSNYYVDDADIKKNMLNPNVFNEDNANWKKAQEKATEQRQAFDKVQIPERNSFPNVQVGKFSNIDVQKIAERYKKRVDEEKKSVSGVIAFVSFSMPDASIKKIIADTLKVNGTVLFIGFKNNEFKETAKEIRRLDIRKGNIQINPNAFKQYKIDVVPSIVLVKAKAEERIDEEGCVLPENYSKVTGDVSLEYALELMAKNETADLKNLANDYLNQARRGKTNE